MACPVLLGVALVGIAPFVPGYDPVKGLVSKLSLGNTAWLGTLIFALLAATAGAFGRALSCSMAEPARFRLPVRLTYAGAFCFFLLMFIKIEPVKGVWTSGRLVHWAVVGAACGSLLLSCLLMLKPMRQDPDWCGAEKHTVAMLVSVAVVSLLALLTVRLWPMSGLYERAIGATVLLWVEVMSLRMLSLSRRRQNSPPGKARGIMHIAPIGAPESAAGAAGDYASPGG